MKKSLREELLDGVAEGAELAVEMHRDYDGSEVNDEVLHRLWESVIGTDGPEHADGAVTRASEVLGPEEVMGVFFEAATNKAASLGIAAH